jgi:hypothetical protein
MMAPVVGEGLVEDRVNDREIVGDLDRSDLDPLLRRAQLDRSDRSIRMCQK